MFSRWFRTPKKPTVDPAWWRAADAVAEAPSAAALAALPRGDTSASAGQEDAERQSEMVAGLEDLVGFAGRHAAALPVLPTQHRVIGADRCHFIAPISLGGDGESAGKLFLTSERLLVVGQRPQAWAWHRVRRVVRSGRDIVVGIGGAPDDVMLRCNTYGEALKAVYLMRRLSTAQPAQ